MRKDTSNLSADHNAEAAITAAHLLHPSSHFGHPRDVLAADHISRDDKRAILASWASDIFAVESVPVLRLYPGTDKAVSYDEIVEALKALDAQNQPREEACAPSSFNIQQIRNRRPQARRFGRFGLCSYRKGDRRRQPFEM